MKPAAYRGCLWRWVTKAAGGRQGGPRSHGTGVLTGETPGTRVHRPREDPASRRPLQYGEDSERRPRDLASSPSAGTSGREDPRGAGLRPTALADKRGKQPWSYCLQNSVSKFDSRTGALPCSKTDARVSESVSPGQRSPPWSCEDGPFTSAGSAGSGSTGPGTWRRSAAPLMGAAGKLRRRFGG